MFDFGNFARETPFCVTSAVMNPGFTTPDENWRMVFS